MLQRISILLVDDHAMLQGALRRRLADEEDMDIVAGASDAETATAMAAQMHPDIILMDIDMPGMSSFEAAKRIRNHSPETRIIFLSAYFHDRYVEQAIASWAWGYVVKTETEQSLIKAIRQVMSGVQYFSPEVQRRLVIDGCGVGFKAGKTTRLSTLTERETEILCYIARGMSKKEIAQMMHLSVHTVQRHTANVMDKLDIHDRVQLTRYAVREGFVGP